MAVQLNDYQYYRTLSKFQNHKQTMDDYHFTYTCNAHTRLHTVSMGKDAGMSHRVDVNAIRIAVWLKTPSGIPHYTLFSLRTY